MTSLLVPLDGSKTALRALDYAIRQAKAVNGNLHLLNVQLLPDTYATVRAYLSIKEHRELTVQHAEAVLKPARDRVRRAGLAFVDHLEYGDIPATIARAARRFKCDSIIMGTRGMGALGNLVLGSIATKVIHLAKCPVTLVT